jgi:hypothetical protein
MMALGILISSLLSRLEKVLPRAHCGIIPQIARKAWNSRDDYYDAEFSVLFACPDTSIHDCCANDILYRLLLLTCGGDYDTSVMEEGGLWNVQTH